MMSVLPNGGQPVLDLKLPDMSAALDDVSATEWRVLVPLNVSLPPDAALDDVSATEWRIHTRLSIEIASSCTR